MPTHPTGTSHRSEINRLRRIEGQVRGLQRMIEEDRYCIDILTQIRSVQRALERVNDGILERHLRHCVVEAVESGRADVRDARITEVMHVLERGR